MVRKRILYVLLAVMMITLVPLTGCGGGGEEAAADDTADIRAAAEGFLDAMEAGDMDKMKEYSDPALFAEDGDLYAFNGIDTMGKEMAEAVGMEESDLSDGTKAALQDFVDTLMAELVTSYEITDVTETDGVGSVYVTTTYGFDPDKMKEIDLQDEISEMTEEYMDEHMDELKQVYADEGQSAMISRLMDGLLGDILQRYTEEVMKTGEVTQDSVMTVENQEGTWVVTAEKPTS